MAARGTDASAKNTGATRLRFATQVHAEAIAIIALRGVMRTIGDHETATAIRERIRDLIAVKAERMGLNAPDFDAKLEQSDAVIAQADAALEKALKQVKS